MDEFGTDDLCRERLTELRWPNGVACPRCGDMKHQYDSKRHTYDCAGCGYQFSVTTGTMLHDTHLPLRKWFIATYLLCESKKSMSSMQIQRTIGVAKKTGWYLTHRIREAMKQAMAGEPLLDGANEVDETYIGGRVRGKGRGYVDNKTIVVGVKQRGGAIRMKVVDRNDRATLHAFIREHISPDAEVIYTDEWTAYRGIADENTRHETVNHRAEEWVRGPVHTNSIEGTWSLFNRAIVGSWHQVQRKHLDAYLKEMEWRQNNRDHPSLFTATLKALMMAEALEYKELIAS